MTRYAKKQENVTHTQEEGQLNRNWLWMDLEAGFSNDSKATT